MYIKYRKQTENTKRINKIDREFTVIGRSS